MRRLFTLLLASTLAAPAGAAAQVCLGYPAGRGETDIGAVVRLRSGLSQFGGTVATQTPSDIVGEAGLTFDHYSSGRSWAFTVGGRAGLELRRLALAPTLALCPFAGAGLSHASGLSTIEVPLGLGFGTVLPLEAATPADSTSILRLLLHAAPTLFLAHTSVPGHTESRATGGLEFGGRIVYEGLYAGAALLVRGGNNNTVFSIYAGLPLPRRGP